MKAHGWDKAESFFANMVEDDEADINDQVQVLLRQLEIARESQPQINTSSFISSEENRRSGDTTYDCMRASDRPVNGKNY